MRNTLFRRLWQIPVILTAIVLTASFFPFQPMALAAETAQEAAEEAGSQAFLDFFGPDGVNDCLQPDTLDGHIALIESSTSTDQLFRGNVLDGLTFSDLQTFHQQGLTLEDVIRQASHRIARSQEQAVLTTVWENVGNGRINRKYLNGLVAFCFDEELAFPNGALYSYAIASDSIITGQAAAIAHRFGQSGVDNAQWWNECQVAIWAVLAGCDSKESASAFARSYCADRGITDADAIADYAHVVGSLVDETMGDSGTAYLYQAADPANQRILTFFPVWPDPAPVYPSPQYDSVSATESYTAVRHHSVSLQRKYAAITDETLSGAVFEIWEDGKPVGTITTDTSGTGSCSWDLPETVSSTVTKEYCSNYDKLDPETRKEVTGYTNREEAYIAAQAEAQADARTQAEADADRPRTVTIRETSVPTGFSYIGDGTQTVTLTGDDTASLSVTNDPWKATFLIDKVDGITGERIADETIFALYEWNGSSYQISSHYQVIRLTDGTYTVSPCYPEGQTGYLYYTQQNQGRFGLLELQAPDNYYSDSQIFYFEIHKDDAVIYGRNASPDDYPIADDTKFANLPKPQPLYADVTVTEDRTSLRSHQITLDKKTSAITGEAIEGAVFQVYEDGQPVGTITTDAQGMGNCQWTVQGSASITITETYCSNYDDLEPEEQARVTVFSSQEQALASAREQAASQAQALADTEADRPRTVSVKEVSAPAGFLSPRGSLPEMTLTGNDSTVFQAENLPYQGHFSITKVDGITGQIIPADTVFTLYEWNGNTYEISPHYQMIRLEDGTYTVSGSYPHSEIGSLYYTQQNQGRFALAEDQAPHGYIQDTNWFYFQITEEQQHIVGHNAKPENYPICDDTKFANQPVTGTIEITKHGDYLTGADIVDASEAAPQFTRFQYTSGPVAGTVFSIYAAEDILQPGGSDQLASYNGILLVKDTLVATTVTDTSGLARVEGLPLGTYYIRETDVGDGAFLLDPTTAEVTLSYEDQNLSVVADSSTYYYNQRQKVSVTLTKKSRPLSQLLCHEHWAEKQLSDELLSQLLAAPQQSPEAMSTELLLPGAVYGLYAAEDIYGYVLDETNHSFTESKEPLLSADTLLECVTTDSNGQATWISDLPCGTYYIRELTPPAGYLLSDEIHVLDANYTGQNGVPVLSLTHTSYNDPICLSVIKIDSTDQKPLTGAHLSLHRSLGEGEWSLVARWISEETPKLLSSLLPGQYLLVEDQAPAGYLLTAPVEFTLSSDQFLTVVEMANTPTPPEEPVPTSSEGAPTGDASSLSLCCWCALVSGSIAFLLRKKFANFHRSSHS